MKKVVLSGVVVMALLINAIACTYRTPESSYNQPTISAEELISFAEQSGEV